MAKIKYGGGVAEMRGSEAGTTHSRNRAGAYTRQRVTPVNPQSTNQQIQRQRVTDLAKNWGAVLTQVQRDAWSAFAANFPVTDVFGDQIILTGSQAYVKINTRLGAAGLTLLTAAPANQDVSGFDTLSGVFDVATPTQELTFTPDPIPAGDRIQMIGTPAVGPGVSYVKNRLRLFSTSGDSPASPYDFSADWTARFGSAPAVGQKVVAMCRIIRAANGAISAPQRLDMIVV